MKPPVALAKSYARWLAKRYDQVFAEVLPTLLDGWDRNPVHFSGRVGLHDSAYHVAWRVDASDYVNKAIRKLIHTFDEHPIDPHAVTGLGAKVAAENAKHLRVAGIPTSKLTSAARIAQFRDNNLALIKSLDSEAVDRLRTLLETAEKDAARVETLRAQIVEAFGATRSHADLIARDQVLKLNGQITEDRQTGAGIMQYTWSTSGDERVRPGHEELDGTVQSWSDPPEVDEKSGRRAHPGGDYQCRCVAIPEL